ncbi:ADP-sugar pyrophosphatase [Hondaea fermentalgiana]|uniref:ADP-sugar pyrophosphatase n=1 Tax=Hondaea fermentalgiana TaxID=2315210 RepID=A0A2R5GLL7_9STRA|nr:ADP-sugar pyrophosphatase [Hondaea fermentalgiana]|eukprot:GBG31770.1 ADP-sugar pyrophosphatase [Hondaea fermentalgiana]
MPRNIRMSFEEKFPSCDDMDRETESGEAPSLKDHAEKVHDVPLEAPGFRWVRLVKQTFRNEKQVEKEWEFAERTTRKGEIDAVFIVATVVGRMEGQGPETLVISQYRPPTDSYVLEFPAGLVDEGEDAETAALRELREETGYLGEVKSVSDVLFVDPGLSNANLKFVNVTVDCTNDLNREPVPKQDEDEFIQTHLVPQKDLLKSLRNPRHIETEKSMLPDTTALKDRSNVTVSGLLYAYALGLAAAQSQHV